MHIGGLRTALYNELLARNKGGNFVLRIEDTDQNRKVEGGIENICRSLQSADVIPNEGIWLDEQGVIMERGDKGPYLQSKNKERHLAYAKKLIDMDKAYYCFCTQERLEALRHEQESAKKPTMYDSKCCELSRDEAEEKIKTGEKYVIRLKLPKTGDVTFTDEIRGDVKFDWSVIDDQVIIKSDGFPTYHLASTCDDHDMEISHVIRGEEWISSTPKHIFIYQSLGWEIPKFAHLPLLLNPDRSKLSKRQGDVALEDYLKKGYLPEAIINFVALLGWNPTADREIYSHDELVKMFDLKKINKAGAVFNLEKLDWLNAHYLRELPEDKYLELTRPFVKDASDDKELMDRALILVRDRIKLPSDVAELTRELFKDELDYSQVSLTWKSQKTEEATERLKALKEILESEDRVPNAIEIEKKIKDMITTNGWSNGDTLWPLRVALSGAEKSPTPFELLHVLGKKRSLGRIDQALSYLKT